MADLKISALPASTTPLAGTEVLPIVQSSTTKQVSVANLTAGRAVSALSLTTTQAITGGSLYQVSGFSAYRASGASTSSPGDASMYFNSATGQTFQARAGSSYDFSLINPGNANYIARNPTGTLNIEFLGGVAITGALSKGSGSFRIQHPLPEKKQTHDLVHSFIEGPKADLIYRGLVKLQDGLAQVNIDEVSQMTLGTFVVLCRTVQCFTTNETGWIAVRGKVTGNILSLESQQPCNDEVSWMVIGERQDEHMIDTDWTDDQGHVIVEPKTRYAFDASVPQEIT